MLIRICSFSKEGASKTKGLVLKEKLEKGIIQHESITVDFTGVDCYASPFFNNSFAALALKYGFEVIEKIKLENLSFVAQETYQTSMDNAKMLLSRPDFVNQMNLIIQEPPKDTEG